MAAGTRNAAASRGSREMAALVSQARPKTAAERAPKVKKGKGAKKAAKPVE